MGAERQLTVERWRQIQAEVRNIARHVRGTTLGHWGDSLEFLARDCGEEIERQRAADAPPSVRPASREELAAWCERALAEEHAA